MTIPLWSLIVLLTIDVSQGRNSHTFEGPDNFHQWDGTSADENGESQEELPNAQRSANPNGSDLSRIEIMLNRMSETMSQRTWGFNGGGGSYCGNFCGNGCCNGCCNGCGNGCGGSYGTGSSFGDWPKGKPPYKPNTMDPAIGNLSGAIQYSHADLKNDLAILKLEMNQCCSRSGDGQKPRESVESMLPIILNGQKEIKNILKQIENILAQLVQTEEARRKEYKMDYSEMAAQFEASRQKFTIEMERQFKKFSESNLCPNPSYKRVGEEVGEEKWRITQPPIIERGSRSHRNRNKKELDEE